MIDELERIATMFNYAPRAHANVVRFEDSQSVVIPCFEQISPDTAFAFLSVRTTSYDFEGERTDLHDVISEFVAVFLRVFGGMSCSLWDVPNSFTRIPTEIYARYVTIDQPSRSIFRLDASGIEAIEKLVATTRLFTYTFPSMMEFQRDPSCPFDTVFGYTDADTVDWSRRVAEVLRHSLNSQKIQYNRRGIPSWSYFRTIKHGISVLKAPRIASTTRDLLASTDPWERISGVRAMLYVSPSARNAIPHEQCAPAQRIIEKLDGDAAAPLVFIPLENYFVAIGKAHIVFCAVECGLKEFEADRERVRERHAREMAILFPAAQYVWNDEIDDAQFESLIRDMVELEPGVRWVRQAGATRERDEGRDLICEWKTPPTVRDAVSEDAPPGKVRRVIVQCKASKNSVGKGKVQDIHDTIRLHDCEGYLLVVSSQITAPLMRHLESIRLRGEYWMEWWSRSEIENRLRRAPDVAQRHSAIVKLIDDVAPPPEDTGN